MRRGFNAPGLRTSVIEHVGRSLLFVLCSSLNRKVQQVTMLLIKSEQPGLCFALPDGAGAAEPHPVFPGLSTPQSEFFCLPQLRNQRVIPCRFLSCSTSTLCVLSLAVKP